MKVERQYDGGGEYRTGIAAPTGLVAAGFASFFLQIRGEHIQSCKN
jgi:hypothetical protein